MENIKSHCSKLSLYDTVKVCQEDDNLANKIYFKDEMNANNNNKFYFELKKNHMKIW